ncbi:MAG: phosphatase PAP2 family protein [Candidatus Pacebacteria bacterium]|nr:phosphatase PAP2 family protein [Melioribacteraceae bacterium]MCK5591642.1 phosphatase PAP2 family protein [Candidatus Paceibacterota bacterium]
MDTLKRYFLNLQAPDLLIVVFATFLSVVNLVFAGRVPNWPTHVALNTLVTILVFVISNNDEKHENIFWQQLHYWYIVPLIFLSFKELYFMVYPIRGMDYDLVLIEIDRFLFGADPTFVLYEIANPYLTELLQIVYATFFFLPIILGIDLLLNNQERNFRFTIFTIVLGFFLSFIGYLLVPAIGPRFTLHDFAATNSELPGLFLTNYLREIVNAGESIRSTTPNAAEIVQRDVFPSGHTQMTLIVMYLSVKFRTVTRFIFLPVGTLLIFSTVYLRYHYVIDLIGGLVFMIITVLLTYKLYNWWVQLKGEEKFEYPKF